jgi:hypothetical protein
LTAIELRAAAGREKDSAASRRMLALAMVFDGADRTSKLIQINAINFRGC